MIHNDCTCELLFVVKLVDVIFKTTCLPVKSHVKFPFMDE